MKTLSERLAQLRAAKEAERAALAQANSIWLQTVEPKLPPGFAPSLNTIHLVNIRAQLEDGLAKRCGIACDTCHTELARHVNIEMAGPAFYLACPGCGEFLQHEGLSEVLKSVQQESNPEVLVLTQLVALLFSNPPVVLERRNDCLTVELSQASPFAPFELNNPKFKLTLKGTQLTIELQDTSEDTAERTPTLWEHLTDS